MFPQKIDIVLKSDVFKNFRCQVAANSLDIDSEKKSIHHLHIDDVDIPDEWNIGLIYGSSGSGKTTLCTQLFGDDIFHSPIDPEKPIINQFPEHLNYDDCAALLNGIGLTSVPCWIRPVKTLSNGQKARAEAALMLTQSQDVIFIDEWTSVVDRTVAKAMSVCLNKFTKRTKKKVVVLSCHYDIIEWLSPDWIIDCNKQRFELPKSDSFFFSERDKIKFDIKEIGPESWKYFSKYHYLTDKLPKGKIYLYGLFLGDEQIGFQCFANYVPKLKHKNIIFHSNRTVIHPDYAGLGLGIKLINETSYLLKNKIDCEIMAKFSSLPVYKVMKKQDCWHFIKSMKLFTAMKQGGSMSIRKNTFREKGVTTFHFRFVPKK